ncbi:hypothetical protein [Cereibacter azotoformans]|uniref:Uncharacterized protein n=1 Tax=Cereibacter azotoformans TaxID=43057 RepID=A0A2T5K703_9RHOB|nr:hypothetical protein [Cereibacter azotoformans]MBO4169526.1 hypothetical protein [Cereibacter azotoformans]PTR18203.1 hypothetical protein C8J28_109163 [Cereibacter azotoformans]
MTAPKFLELLTALIAAASGGDVIYSIEHHISRCGCGTITVKASYIDDLVDADWTHLTGPGFRIAGHSETRAYPDGFGGIERWVTWDVVDGEIVGRDAPIDVTRRAPTGGGPIFSVAS